MKRVCSFLPSIGAAFLAFSPCLPAAAAQPMVFPGKDWRQAAPESQGVNSANLNEALSFLGQRRWPSAPPRTFTPRGGRMNYCFVVPEWNMVIVHLEPEASLKRTETDQIWDEFFSRLAGAVDMGVSGNPKIQRKDENTKYDSHAL